MSEITKKDKKILNSKDEKTLAEWWCSLNSWGWESELPDEPRDVGLKLSERTSQSRRLLIMNYIEKKIGKKKCLNEWVDKMINDSYQE